MTIQRLKNRIQTYDWGSHSAISNLLGKPSPSAEPQAEMWLGAHPKAPSSIQVHNRWISLETFIARHPSQVLGPSVTRRFGSRLPFLFKFLSAAKPLSIQVHPNADQAEIGFERENREKIPLDAPQRNYRDSSHKPECICAITPFWALCGFRKIEDTLRLMAQILPRPLESALNELKSSPDSNGLKRFFTALMGLDHTQKSRIVESAVEKAARQGPGDDPFEWMVRLNQAYPADIGVFSPLFLNLICLQPGEALFLPSGVLHAYLEGTGIELMANSDNVLRGGLTHKHIDVDELIKVLRFDDTRIKVLTSRNIRSCEYQYQTGAKEFELSVIRLESQSTYQNQDHRNIEILLATQGEGGIIDPGAQGRVTFKQGESFLIPASVSKYRIEGTGVLYKATVPD